MLRRVFWITLAAGALLMLSAGCGGSTTAGSGSHHGTVAVATQPGCEFAPINVEQFTAPFQNPPEIDAAHGVLSTTLTVAYALNQIAKCQVYLRSYNGQLVGPTLRAKPGDTLRIHLDNQLPPDTDHGVMNTLHAFNTTNLHTHGLHVSPVGNSDNVLLEVAPGTSFDYEIKIPPNQAPGTYWYHAHLHGSTATQVSSGMAGALIIEGGLDDNKQIAAAQEQVLVLQQIQYDEKGALEPSDPNSTQFGPCSWEDSKREHTINGQLFPTITMKSGEVQRWRMIHAGIRESIGVELRGPGPDNAPMEKVLSLAQNPLNEIAVDGIALGKLESWEQVELEPGYRSDVLVQLTKPGIYYLVDNGVQTSAYVVSGTEIVTGTGSVTSTETVTSTGIVTSTSDSLTCPGALEQPNLLARVVVTDTTSANMQLDNMQLPAPASLAQFAPYAPLIEISTGPITGTQPINDQYVMSPTVAIDGFQRVDFTVAGYPPSPIPQNVTFLAADHPFSPDRVRQLKLNNTEEWVLETSDDSLYYAHPFHIHVNPFQTWRFGPDGTPETVWRDTLLVRRGIQEHVFSHYTDYIGKYVYHCHILDHEDQGMMELVEIVN